MPDQKKILIIDDEKDLCILLKDYFLRKKHIVSIVNTLHEAKLLINTMLPDILLLDNNLPDGTTWNYAAKIAKEYPNIYIVFISAFNTILPEMPKESKFSYIEKPISFAALDGLFKTIY